MRHQARRQWNGGWGRKQQRQPAVNEGAQRAAAAAPTALEVWFSPPASTGAYLLEGRVK